MTVISCPERTVTCFSCLICSPLNREGKIISTFNLHLPQYAITDTFFPYDDYRVDVTWEEIEGLPEEYTGLTNQKQLRAMVLSLVRQQDGHEVDRIIIDRLDYENASSAE